MESKTIYARTKSLVSKALYSWIFDILPESVIKSLDKADVKTLESITEIRLRADGASGVTAFGENYILTKYGIKECSESEIRLSDKDIEDFLYKLCHGSVYSYEGSIKRGFITVNGVRTGISGDVVIKDSEVSGFSKIRSVNIRLPRHIPNCADNLLSYISHNGFKDLSGILIASVPGVGKTTVLRELAIGLSRGIKTPDGKEKVYRVSVIDERCELYIPCLFENCYADVFCGIPKHTGIELATRTMSPEIIIFDEIGSENEAKAVMSAHFSGVTFISSVHASSAQSARNKSTIRMLIDEGIFTHIYFLSRTDDGIKGTLSKV